MSSEDVARLRAVLARPAGRGRHARPGVTEIELFRTALAAARTATATRSSSCRPAVGPEDRGRVLPVHVASPRVVQDGEAVNADIALGAQGYWGDSAETHIAGPNEEVAQIRAGLLEILAKASRNCARATPAPPSSTRCTAASWRRSRAVSSPITAGTPSGSRRSGHAPDPERRDAARKLDGGCDRAQHLETGPGGSTGRERLRRHPGRRCRAARRDGGAVSERAALLELYRRMVEIREFEDAGPADVRAQPGARDDASVPGPGGGRGRRLLRAARGGHDDLHLPRARRGAGDGSAARPGHRRRSWAGPTGCARGKGGSMHLTDVGVGALGSFASSAPICRSRAAPRSRRRDGAERASVSVSFFGDGTTNIGAFHEAMNLASVWKLGIVVRVREQPLRRVLADRDDNPRGAARRPGRGLRDAGGAGRRQRRRGRAGRRRRRVRGCARAGHGPTFLEALTYRHMGHSRRRSRRRIGPEGENERWRERDPITLVEQRLEDDGVGAGRPGRRAHRRPAGGRGRRTARALAWPDPEPDDRFEERLGGTAMRRRHLPRGRGSGHSPTSSPPTSG